MEDLDPLVLQTPEIVEFEQAEWVFQFDNEEPVVFAWANTPGEKAEVSINLKSNSGTNLEFRDRNGKVFRIFAREITEPTLKMLEQNGNIE